VVGEPISLKSVLSQLGGANITGYSWSVPVTVAKSQVWTATTGSTPLLQGGDQNSSSLLFYFLFPTTTSTTVTLSVTLSSGGPLSANIRFKVIAPSPTLSVSTHGPVDASGSRVNVKQEGPNWVLRFGFPETPPPLLTGPGIRYSVLVRQSSIAGLYSLVQTVQPQRRRFDNGGTLNACFPAVWVIDTDGGMVEYGETPRISVGRINTRDTPTVGLDNSFLRYEVANEPLRAYVMFRPQTAGSIWVPLVYQPWSWGGTAQNEGASNWSLATGTGQWSPLTSIGNPFVNGQVFSDVTLIPTWIQFADALNWGPCF